MLAKDIHVLLVEDDASHVALFQAALADDPRAPSRVSVAGSAGQALALLDRGDVDVALLDLGLPDSEGAGTVSKLHAADPALPIIVLTSSDDPGLAVACIERGAQDYLQKSDVTARTLARSFTFALARRRQAEIEELKSTLERYRMDLAGDAAPAVAGRSYADDGTARRRHPEVMALIDQHYQHLLDARAARRTDELTAMGGIARSLASLDAGPRDLMAVHLQALERAIRHASPENARAYAVAARSLIIEMMARLTEAYMTPTGE